MREYKLFLEDIVNNIKIIKTFTEGMDFDDFKKDLKTIYSVTRALEIIGEATAQIPKSIREKHNTISWKEIKGFRDKIVHKYWGVDLEIEWNIIEEELDKLEKEINLILKKL